ncbi:MAG: NAD-binding protein [Spirochaetaceae bacterium]|nr:NAD-binding protein [Spirochaetaceae bacterium]
MGAGRIGIQLAAYLIRERHDVAIIESSEERARHASNRLDCLVLHDEGNSLRSLEDAGIRNANALVCATDSDEVNMIICGIAESRCPKLLKIACVRNDDYLTLGRHIGEGHEDGLNPEVLGIDFFVHPDVEASRAALNAIEHGAIGDVLSFAGADYELGSIEIAKGSALDGLSLRNYRDVIPGETLVTFIERDGRGILPDGSTTLMQGDRAYIFAKGEELVRVFELGGSAAHSLNRIGIAGGGEAGRLIAESLLGAAGSGVLSGILRKKTASVRSFFSSLLKRTSRRLVLIENDYELSKNLAAQFPGALVLNEDIRDESFIAEESLNDLDLIVTTTGNQELNIITALYLKSRGVKRAIAMVKSDGYAEVARRLGVDVVISIKAVVVDAILSRLVGGGVTGIHRLGGGMIDIFEIEIKASMPIVNQPITAFRLSGGGLLMHVNRAGKSFIPHGGYLFRENDKIVLIAKNSSEKDLEKFFHSPH